MLTLKLNKMRIVKIASTSESKKVIYTASGEKFYLPERFRNTVAVGLFALVATQKINVSAKDESGQPIVENGQVKLSGETAERDTVTMVGEFKDVVVAKNESRIFAGAEEIVVRNEQKSAAEALGLTTEELSAAV